jgi:hypothetical protein
LRLPDIQETMDGFPLRALTGLKEMMFMYSGGEEYAAAGARIMRN